MAIFNSELLVYQRVPVIKRGWDNPYLDGWFYIVFPKIGLPKKNRPFYFRMFHEINHA